MGMGITRFSALSVPTWRAVTSAMNLFSLGHVMIGHPQRVKQVATNLRRAGPPNRLRSKALVVIDDGHLLQSVRVPLVCHSKPWE
jgi:hypothetical protein